MKRILTHNVLLLTARYILGLVFIIASVEKIAIPELFAANIQAYQVMPMIAINLIALVIPWLELICGIFLLSGVFVRSSSLLLSLLLGMFIILIILAILQGLKIDCGCFGSSHESPVGWMRVLEDIGLLVIGLYIFYISIPGKAISAQDRIA
jgi:putative oxidoreductase